MRGKRLNFLCTHGLVVPGVFLGSLFFVGCKPPAKDVSTVQEAVGVGVRLEANVFVGLNAMVVAVGGDRHGLAAVIGMNAGLGARADGIRVTWDTENGGKTIAGKYCVINEGSEALTPLIDLPKGSEQIYKRRDGLTMTVANLGVGVNLQLGSCVVVVSLGVPSGKSEKELDRMLRESNDPNVGEYRSSW